MTKDYFEIYADRYRSASPETRAASKAAWLSHYRKNLAAGNQDMIAFCSRFLAIISMVESEEAAA